MSGYGHGLTQRYGWWWCALSAVLFGAATPAIKVLVDDVGSVALAGLLYIGAASAVAPVVALQRRPAERAAVARHHRVRLLLAVGMGSGIAPVLLVMALDRSPASTVSLLLNTELVVTVVISRVFLREHVGSRTATGVVMVLLGGVILAGTASGGAVAGALLVVATCVCWGIDNSITASLDRFSPAQITLAKGAVAGSVNLAIGISMDGVPEVRFILAALVVGMLGYGVSIALWITGARLIGAARGQAIFALAPFIGAAVSWLVIEEELSLNYGIAFVVSFAGVFLLASARHWHAHVHDTIEHAHAIDATDPHHAEGLIEVLAGNRHRHLAVEHDHDHLPDIHHRHDH